MKVRVKICGLRRPEDVIAAVEAGADALGFNFWEGSKRFVSPAEARALVALLPRHVLPVGVFVNASPAAVAAAVELSGVRAAQLHGAEDPAGYADVPAELIQVVRLSDESSLPSGPASPAAGLVLLDARVPGFGGAGVRFDWALVAEARRRLEREVLVAGGLTPGNVGEAIGIASPWGVDVASGVESAPGVKDPELLRAFVAAARAAGEAA